MKLRALFPKPIRLELEAVADGIKHDDPSFDPEHEPWHLVAVVLVWAVRQIVILRDERP